MGAYLSAQQQQSPVEVDCIVSSSSTSADDGDIEFDPTGAQIRSAILQSDCKLLRSLLQRASPYNPKSLIPISFRLPNNQTVSAVTTPFTFAVMCKRLDVLDVLRSQGFGPCMMEYHSSDPRLLTAADITRVRACLVRHLNRDAAAAGGSSRVSDAEPDAEALSKQAKIAEYLLSNAVQPMCNSV